MAGIPLWGTTELATALGTSRSTFQLDSDSSGPKLKNNSNVLEFRNDADSNYIIVRGLTPVNDNDLATKAYVDAAIQGITDWQESVLDRYDPTTSTPASPSIGDRYLSTATANSWTVDNIYEYDGSNWVETVKSEGMATWVEDEDVLYLYNGTAWVKFGSTVSHNNTNGLQGGTTNEYYHLTSAQHTEIVAFFAATDITGAEAEELTDGSNTSLHIHDGRYYTETETDTLISNLTDGTTTFTNIDVDGGTIDGITLGTNSAVTEAQIDNININGSTISDSVSDDTLNIVTTGNGNIALTPAGTGEVDISKVDIDSGAIDNTIIGANTPADGYFTNISGAVTATYQAVTSNLTLDDEDSVISVDTSSGAVTLSLPDADTLKGHQYKVYLESDGNDLTISCPSGDTFDDGSSTSGVIDTAGVMATLTAVSANIWHIECSNVTLS